MKYLDKALQVSSATTQLERRECRHNPSSTSWDFHAFPLACMLYNIYIYTVFSMPSSSCGSLHIAYCFPFFGGVRRELSQAILIGATPGLSSVCVVDEVWMFLTPVESLISFVNSWMERHSLPKVLPLGGRLEWKMFNREMASLLFSLGNPAGWVSWFFFVGFVGSEIMVVSEGYLFLKTPRGGKRFGAGNE